MSSFLRRAVSRYVPTHFHDPVGLAMRLVRTRDPAALFAMQTALLGLFLTPFDILLSLRERRLLGRFDRPKQPLILVCGPPRSATTLVAQVLMKHLPVAYFNNLTSLFPRSPLTANSLFGRFLDPAGSGYKSYYGKTTGLNGLNDALYLWDRWLGADRKRIPESIPPEAAASMAAFFAACESFFGRPVMNKNNGLCTCAHLVAKVLDTAVFLCLDRDPRYLAQSLLKARADMYGDADVAYGTDAHRGLLAPGADPVDDVCAQVVFYQRTIDEQERLVGRERFWRVCYEEFCKDPASLVARVADRILRVPVDVEALRESLPPFEISGKVRVGGETFGRIERALARLGEAAPAAGGAPSA